MSRNIYGKSENFKKWHNDYTNKCQIFILKYFSQKEIQILRKLGIIIKNKLYTQKEFDQINEYLFDYYKTNNQDKIIQSEPLKKKKISESDYENILNIFNKIAEDYDL